jgi:hypothetical protein
MQQTIAGGTAGNRLWPMRQCSSPSSPPESGHRDRARVRPGQDSQRIQKLMHLAVASGAAHARCGLGLTQISLRDLTTIRPCKSAVCGSGRCLRRWLHTCSTPGIFSYVAGAYWRPIVLQMRVRALCSRLVSLLQRSAESASQVSGPRSLQRRPTSPTPAARRATLVIVGRYVVHHRR